MRPLILASTSRYRRELLQRLGLSFESVSPDVDEAPASDETPAQTAVRLAYVKSAAVTARFPEAWVIGSDQVAELDGEPLGKPGTPDMAHLQLQRMSGQVVQFHTAVCITRGQQTSEVMDITRVHFRTLQDSEIRRYVDTEMPLDCAGSFKCEGLGISLFEAIHSQDPTALIGLPLIALSKLLRQAGYSLP